MRVRRALGLQLRMPGKRSRIRCSVAHASTNSWLAATSVTRHKTPVLIRENENAWTEVDAETSLAHFPASRCSGMLTPSRSALRRASRSRPRPEIPASAATKPPPCGARRLQIAGKRAQRFNASTSVPRFRDNESGMAFGAV